MTPEIRIENIAATALAVLNSKGDINGFLFA
jgi:hypothetical protein